MTRPTLLFDGECGFCRDAVARWEREAGDALEVVPFQDRGERFPDVSDDEAAAAAQWIGPEGERLAGAAAVFAVLALCGRPRWQRLAERWPWFLALAERVYRGVANHRGLASRLARRVWGTEQEPARQALVRWLFLRALGVVFLLAFVSLWTQVQGLFGAGGLRPVQATLDAALDRYGAAAFVHVPTLLWLGASDRALGAVCAGGVFAALLLIQGIAPRLALGVLWACYLSLVTIGGTFTAYQWDGLLLETGLLAILLAPPGRWPRFAESPRPSPVALFLLRLLLFKLMLCSGLVKLLSDDPTWRSLTALQYHFWTQPIPTPLGAQAARLPVALLKAATALTLVIEIAVPFVMFFLRETWARWTAFACFAGLQVLIALTGNYGFFNLLTLALCLLLLEDGDLRRCLPGPLRGFFAERPRRAVGFWGGAAVALLGLPLLVGSLAQIDRTLRQGRPLPQPVRAALDAARPLRSCNGYGLFARMTTRRYELRVEGTRDGLTWKTYRFRYGTGPVWVPPGHMPRLDWEAWFLPHRYVAEWVNPLGIALLRGTPAVKRLFANDPFPDAPPRDVRIRQREVVPTGDAAGWKPKSRYWSLVAAWSR